MMWTVCADLEWSGEQFGWIDLGDARLSKDP